MVDIRKHLNRAKTAAIAFLSDVDGNDVQYWGGLGLVFWGCWSVYSPAAPLVCGSVMVAVGFYGAKPKPKRRAKQTEN